MIVERGSSCTICDLPLGDQPQAVCSRCAQKRPPYLTLRSWGSFEGPLRAALHRMKYRRDLGLGEALSRSFSEFISGLNWDVQLLVPIPLGKERLIERGYNQVGLVAGPLAMRMQIIYKPNALVRIKNTKSQVGLSVIERKLNVTNAFRAISSQVVNRNILLLDDVATTGATIESAADALLAAGANKVYAATIARAQQKIPK